MLRKVLIVLCVPVCLAMLTGFMHRGVVSGLPEITAAPGQVNPYMTRSELLMDAARYTGVSTPEQAVDVWAKGLEQRSAAMQYIVMTDALKGEYAKQLDALRSNWVTGMSSPWVSGYTVTEASKPDDAHAEFSLNIETEAAYIHEDYKAKLWLVREGEFWRIDRIQADPGLYWYTLYQP